MGDGGSMAQRILNENSSHEGAISVRSENCGIDREQTCEGSCPESRVIFCSYSSPSCRHAVLTLPLTNCCLARPTSSVRPVYRRVTNRWFPVSGSSAVLGPAAAAPSARHWRAGRHEYPVPRYLLYPATPPLTGAKANYSRPPGCRLVLGGGRSAVTLVTKALSPTLRA